MATKRSVIVDGAPVVDEQGVASAEVRPGYLVDGVTSIAHHASAAANTPRAFALERDELGTGIDNTYQGPNTPTAYYASGDRVKVGYFKPGEVVTAFIASGVTLVANDRVESAGDGTLRKLAAGVALGVSLDSPGAATVLTAVRIRIM